MINSSSIFNDFHAVVVQTLVCEDPGAFFWLDAAGVCVVSTGGACCPGQSLICCACAEPATATTAMEAQASAARPDRIFL